MAVIGNAPFQGLVSGGNIIDASIEGVDLSTSAIAARLGYTPVDPGAAVFTANPTISSGTANSVSFLNGSKVVSGSSNLTFDGTTLTAAGFSGPLNGTVGATTAAAGAFTTLSASGAVTLSGGTTSGVAYLSGSKVVTSGSAFTFNGTNVGIGLGGVATNAKLEVAATTGEIFRADGAGGGFRIVANQTDILLQGTTSIQNWINGTELMRLSSTGLSVTGNLNITSPAFTDSIATINSTSTNVSQRLNFTANGTLQTQIYDDSTETRISAVTSKPLTFRTANTEHMRITSAGNVAIGSTSVTAGTKFSVTGNNVCFTPNTEGKDTHTFSTAAADDGTYAIKSNTTTTIYLHSNGASYFNRGNLGIGTTTPATKLHIQSNNADPFNTVDTVLTLTQGGGNAGSGTQINFVQGAGTNWIRSVVTGGNSNTGSALVFGTAATGVVGSERIRIDSSGNLLVGLTSVLTNGKLQIAGGIGLSGNTQIRQATNADGNTLQLFATQVVVGVNNGTSYSYTGGSLLASLANSASAVTLDVGGTTAGHRLQVVNDGTGQSGTLNYSNAGTSRFYVNSSTGFVGINSTTSNGQLLKVGDAGSTLNSIIGMSASSTGNCQLWFGDSDSNVGYILYDHTNNYMGFRTNGAEAIRITSTGNLGIGTTAPTSKLHISATSAIASQDLLTLDGGAEGFSGPNDAGTGYSVIFNACGYSVASGVVQRTGAAIQMLKSNSWNQADVVTGTKASIVFKTNNGTIATPDLTERMRIDAAGRVMIGTTSTDTSGVSVAASALAPLLVQGPVNGLLGADTSLHSYAIFGGSQFGSTQDGWGGGITIKPIYARGATVFLGALNDGANMEGGSHFVVRSGNYQNNTAERFRITGSGILVTGHGAGWAYTSDAGSIVLSNGNSDTPNLQFATGNNKNWGIDSWNSGGGTQATQYLRLVKDINESGGTVAVAISPSGNIGLGGAYDNTGVGIKFPATQSASSDANTLDDYEEGTWTPVVTSTGGSYANQSGRYTKIGRVVVCDFFVQNASAFTYASASAAWTITGLPFTPSGFGYSGSTGSVWTQGLNYNNTESASVKLVSPTATTSVTILFRTSDSGASSGYIRNENNSSFIVTGQVVFTV
jgi:hypothetical protein